MFPVYRRSVDVAAQDGILELAAMRHGCGTSQPKQLTAERDKYTNVM